MKWLKLSPMWHFWSLPMIWDWLLFQDHSTCENRSCRQLAVLLKYREVFKSYSVLFLLFFVGESNMWYWLRIFESVLRHFPAYIRRVTSGVTNEIAGIQAWRRRRGPVMWGNNLSLHLELRRETRAIKIYNISTINVGLQAESVPAFACESPWGK